MSTCSAPADGQAITATVEACGGGLGEVVIAASVWADLLLPSRSHSVCWAFSEFSGVTTAVPTGLPSHTIGCTSLRQHGSASLGA